MFFSFDGLDGVGKSTQMDLFVEWLRLVGTTWFSAATRAARRWARRFAEVLLGHEVRDFAVQARCCCSAPPGAALVEEVIRPALAAGKTVVSDRFLLANAVYQGHAGGLDVAAIWRVGQVATAGLMPEMVFLLDMPPRAASERIDRQLDRMENQGAEFQARLRDGFLAEAAADPARIVVVDALASIDAVQRDIRAAAERALKNG